MLSSVETLVFVCIAMIILSCNIRYVSLFQFDRQIQSGGRTDMSRLFV